MRILISGFEKFGGDDTNPTENLALSVRAGEIRVAGVELKGVVLPVVYDLAFAELQQAMSSFKPDVVLSLGLASGRDAIEIERVAINCSASGQPDNSGRLIVDRKIEATGETAHFSTLPLHELVESLKEAGIPARISNSAGTYVCNELFYRLQRETKFTSVKSGFVHVPLMEEQLVRRLEKETRVPPSMKFDDMKRALQIMIERLARK